MDIIPGENTRAAIEARKGMTPAQVDRFRAEIAAALRPEMAIAVRVAIVRRMAEMVRGAVE